MKLTDPVYIFLKDKGHDFEIDMEDELFRQLVDELENSYEQTGTDTKIAFELVYAEYKHDKEQRLEAWYGTMPPEFKELWES